MTEDRNKWRKYVYGVANPRSRMAKEQNGIYDLEPKHVKKTDMGMQLI